MNRHEKIVVRSPAASSSGRPGPDTNAEQPAQRSYPLQYALPWTLRNGTPVLLRPIRPEDESLMVQFHRTLSDESVSFRWLHMIGLSQRINHARLLNTCSIDYEQEMALVVDYDNPATNQHEILGVGRIIKAPDANEAEFALLVADQYQRQGLGSELLQRLIQFSREKHIQRLIGYILADNQGMQKVCQKCGFRLWYSQEDQVMKAERVF